MFHKIKGLVCIVIMLAILGSSITEVRATTVYSRSPYVASEEDIYALDDLSLFNFMAASFIPYDGRNTDTIAVATVQRLTYKYGEEKEFIPITCGAVGDNNYRPIQFYGLWSETIDGSPYENNLYHISIAANAVAQTASYKLKITRKNQGRVPDKMTITVKFDNKTYLKRTFKFQFTNAQKRAFKRNKTKLSIMCHEGKDVITRTVKRKKGCKTVGFKLRHTMSIESVYP